MFCAISLSTISFSQTNTLPTNGNVGIGTLTPSAMLDVNGNMVVDSSVIIKDSLEVRKRLTVKQDIKVLGKSVFIGNGRFKGNLTTLGVGKFKDKVIIDGLTRMNGDAKIFGDLKLMNLQSTTNPTLFLTANTNGKVSSLSKAGLAEIVYQHLPFCLSDGNGNVSTTWQQNINNPNYSILYTGTPNCPARVGIGTNTPQQSLDVVGKIKVGNAATSIVMGESNGDAYLDAYTSGPIINRNLYINFNSGKGVIFGNPNFNVSNLVDVRVSGVLSAGPGVVVSQAQFNVIADVGKTYGAYISQGNQIAGAYGLFVKTTRNDHKALSVCKFDNVNGPKELFTVMGDGSVGIGREPDVAVQTLIQAGINKVGLCLISDDTDYNYGLKIIANNPLHKAIAINTQETGGQDVFRVMANGNVFATRVQVKIANNFPDYVFKSNYELMPLAQLENYITKNKHLPNMPTATEVEKEGMDLGEMNRVLVEKVEELTLYMIQMNKRLAQLEKENKLLKK